LQKSSKDTDCYSTDPPFGAELKSPREEGFRTNRKTVLLNLAFFIDHVFSHDRIILLNFHLIWCRPLIFRRRIEVTSAS
jgi:hypothetical protein